MGLMDRVLLLIRVNLNELLDKAEHPEKIIKQLLLDIENQLIQVKTQVAVAITDQHMLEQKAKENEDLAREWMRKAELAVDRNQDGLARAALERYQSYQRLAASFKEQVADQAAQVEELKTAFHKLESKFGEAKARSQLIMARQRRLRAMKKAGAAQMAVDHDATIAGLERMEQQVAQETAAGRARTEMLAESLEDKFTKLEKEDELEKLIGEVKARRPARD